MIYEAEIPDVDYNSNAIENSTLTLKETEQILFNMEVSRDVSIRNKSQEQKIAKFHLDFETIIRLTDYTKRHSLSGKRNLKDSRHF